MVRHPFPNTNTSKPGLPESGRQGHSARPTQRILRLVLLLATVFLASCGDAEPQTGSAIFLGTDSPAERDEILSEVQSSLITDESRSDAALLVRAAERQRTVEGRLVRESIDLSSSTIQYYSVNPMAALAELGTLGVSREALSVIDYGPEGLLPIENRTPRVYVMFNQPMVPIAKLGEPIDVSPIMTVEPSVPGVYRWYGTRTISFEPENPLLEHPIYTVRVAAGTAGLGGGALDKDFSFSLFPETLELVNFYPGSPENRYFSNYNVPPAYAAQFVLEFNQDLDLEALAPSIKISIDNRPVDFWYARPVYPEHNLSRTERAVQISLKQTPAPNRRIDIRIVEGAVPFEDYPPTQQEFSNSIATLSPFSVHFLRGFAGGFPRDNSSYIYPSYLYLSHPLAEGAADLAWEVRVDNVVRVPDSIQADDTIVRFDFKDLRPGQEVSVRVPLELEDIYGRKIVDGNESFSHIIPRPSAFTNFPRQHVTRTPFFHLEREFDPLIAYSFRNQERVSIGSKAFDMRRDLSEQFRSFGLVDRNLSAVADDWVRFELLDLSPYLNRDGFGSAIFSWETLAQEELYSYEVEPERGSLIVFRTDIGISTRVAHNKILVWANRLSDGSPVAGAEVQLLRSMPTSYEPIARGTTDSDGLVAIEQKDGWHFPGSGFVIKVQQGSDIAALPMQSTHNSWRFGINSHSPSTITHQGQDIHIFTDRGLYQAGEELAFRGIHWTSDHNGYTSQSIDYEVSISSRRGRTVVWRDTGTTSASGGFAHRLQLPENMDSGDYTINYRVGNWAFGSRDFHVTSFRRAAFQVTSSINATDVLVGESINAQVEATYLAGGSLPSSAYTYVWTRRAVTYRPPGPQWQHWIFGNNRNSAERIVAQGTGQLSSSGSARISTASEGGEAPTKPYMYSLETRVEDLDRQEISSRTEVLAHPHNEYIAARLVSGSTDGWWSRFLSTKVQATARVQLVDIGGETLEARGAVSWTLIHQVWKSVQQEGLYGRLNNRWEQVDEEIGKGTLQLDSGTADLSFTPPESGQYILRFSRSGAAGRGNETEIPFYATGGGWVRTASQTPSDIELVVDKAEYQPGETARILVQSPVPTGRYLMTIERSGIIEEQVLTLESGTELLEIEVKEEYLPVFYVALSSYTSREAVEEDYNKPDLGKPRALFGITKVFVSTDPVELDVEIEEAAGAYGPGDEVQVTVKVSKNGQAVPQAEVTLLAVDRGVLDLINYRVPNPISYFYNPNKFPLGVLGDDSRRLLLRPVTYDISTLQGGDGVKMEQRDDFNPLALFEPAVMTDEQGFATVKFTLPDSLTTYRVTAVAMEGTRLGLDESEFMVQNPINMRTALPRQFRNRDTAAAGVVLSNLRDEPVDVVVSVESDILQTPGETTKSLTLGPNSVTELPFVLQAAEEGEGSISFTLRSSILNERLTEKVIVERPIIAEAFTTVGVIDEGEDDNSAVEGVIIPSAITEGFGSLDLRLSSSLQPLMLPAVSRILIPTYWYSPDRYGWFARMLDLNTRMLGYAEDGYAHNEVLRELGRYQHSSGGIGYRLESERFSEPNWFLSLLVAHTLQMADEAGAQLRHEIDRAKLMIYLYSELRRSANNQNAGFLLAWTALVLQQEGRMTAVDLERVADLGDSLGIAGYNLLAEAFLLAKQPDRANDLHRRSRNFVNIGAQSVDVKQSYEVRSYFGSLETEVALLLRTGTLLEVDSEYLIRLAGSLSRTQNARRFSSTLDNYWMVLGFQPILQRESAISNMNARVTLDEQVLLEQALNDRTAENDFASFPLFEAPLANLPRNQLLEMALNKDGEGPLYYTSIYRYALPVETALPRDEGIEVVLQIETLDGDVLTGGVLPLGETLRMRVFLNTPRRLSFLTLDVPVPSGAEILNPNLEITGSYIEDGGLQSEEWERETQYGDTARFFAEGYRLWWDYWFYRPIQRYTANSISYTWEDFYEGSREISFLFRTTTPGVYPTPPVQASLQFEPEIFGRTGGQLFVISSESDAQD